jgi:hypothetical protein
MEMRLLATFVVLLVLTGIAQAESIRQERVHFAPGHSSATLTGRLKGYEIVDYAFDAKAGQRATIDFKGSNPSGYFNLLPAGDETAIFVGSTSGNHFDGTLPYTGAYRIRVYLMRNAARRNEILRYTVTLSIGARRTGAVEPKNPDYADGLSGGPDYWQVHGVADNDALNIREGASANSRVLIAVPNGTVLQNQGCRMSGGQKWCKVTQPGGTGITGWVAGRYLREAATPPASRSQKGMNVPASTDSASSEDKRACLAAIAKVTNNTVKVLSSEFSEANSMVMVGVGPNRAPWKCLVSRGRVTNVMSMTDEGAL